MSIRVAVAVGAGVSVGIAVGFNVAVGSGNDPSPLKHATAANTPSTKTMALNLSTYLHYGFS